MRSMAIAYELPPVGFLRFLPPRLPRRRFFAAFPAPFVAGEPEASGVGFWVGVSAPESGAEPVFSISFSLSVAPSGAP